MSGAVLPYVPGVTPPPHARAWNFTELVIRRSEYGWTMYEGDKIVASANDPGQLVNLAVTLEANVYVDVSAISEDTP